MIHKNLFLTHYRWVLNRFHRFRVSFVRDTSQMKMQSTVVKPLSICFLIFICIVHYMDGKPIEEEDYDEDTAVSGMKVVEKEAAIDLPRQVFADLLHKGQFFQDIFSEQPTPNKIQFGHVCENPREWEQRFEQKDMKNNRHQGKVRWGNTNGAYGEHYWDLNHAAAAGSSDKESEDV